MGQIFSKCCSSPEEPNEQPVSTVPAPATPSGVANEPTVHPSGIDPLPSEPIVPLSRVAAPPDEPIVPPSGDAVLPNETAASPNGTTVPPSAPAPETIITSSRERRDQVPNSVRPMSNHNFYRNFWKDAVDTLPKEYKVPEEWRTGTIDKENIVGMVNAKMEECKDMQWKIRVNGEKIVVRDLFKKTLEWIQKFAAVGDTAVQYDPVNAALPWAAFRFLLQVKRLSLFPFYLFHKTRLTFLDSWLLTRRRSMVQCWPV